MDLGEKLRQVRALIDGAQTVGEAEAATAAYQRVIMRHNLDEAEAARLAGREPSPVQGRDVHVGAKGSKECTWKGELLNVLSQFNLCKVYRKEGDSYADMILVGADENVEAVLALWTKLCDLIPRLSADAYLKNKAQIRYAILSRREVPTREDYPHAGNWRYGFHRGFPDGLWDKMKAERDKEKKQFAGTSALILVTDSAIDKWVEDTLGKIRKGDKLSQPQDPNGYLEGYVAGNTWEDTQELGEGAEALPLPA